MKLRKIVPWVGFLLFVSSFLAFSSNAEILNLSNGDVEERVGSHIYLGETGYGVPLAEATTTIDGQGTVLRTTENEYGLGGYIGVGGESTTITDSIQSIVNITNGGLLEAKSYYETEPASLGGWLSIGSHNTNFGTTVTAIVNVDGDESSVKIDNFIGVDSHENVTAELNITNGASVEVTYGYPDNAYNPETGEYDVETYDMCVKAFSYQSQATVNINGSGSSLSVEMLAIGGPFSIVGYTEDGIPVSMGNRSMMSWYSFETGTHVTDKDGNPLYDHEGAPILAEPVAGSYTLPSTLLEGNDIYESYGGSVIVENEAAVYAEEIGIGFDNSFLGAAHIGRFGEDASLTVRDQGVVYSDIKVFEGGILTGDGQIVGNVLVNGGIVSPGNSPGTLTFNGELDLLSGLAVLEIGDLFSVSGDMTIGSEFGFSLLFDSNEAENAGLMDSQGIFSINLEDFFEVYGSMIVGDGFSLEGNLEIVGLGVDEELSISFLNEQATLTGSPVPIPAGVWLLGSGLLGIVGLRNRLK